MGGGQGSLTGPDLKQGVAAADLPDGGKLLGHADGEAVLLVRKGSQIFAVGATCTHYGGPLAEGLVVDETVRCPWHHACFDLHTGEALHAPALNAIPCYRVEQKGEKLIVAEKLVRGQGRPGGNEPLKPIAAAQGAQLPSSVVIVGAGAAGLVAAETLRREGYEGPVTLVGEDPSVPVDRPNLSKDYLAGNAPEEWIPLRPAEFFAEHRIATQFDTPVEQLDLAKKQVVLRNGKTVPYGALILSTGASPIRLDLPGGDLPHVFYLRTLADSRAIIGALGSAKRAVVIGGGFIGLEVAASLRTRGLEVHVVAPEARPLERVLGPQLGEVVRAIHEEHGVQFHLQNTATKIERDAVVLKSGERLAADLVVIGVGVRPNTALAEKAGLKVDKGIVVDSNLKTSAPDVYAAGDVARFPDGRSGEWIRIEHWAVAERQGRVAALNVLGAGQLFDAVPFFWSQHYDVPIAYVGHAEKWDRIDVAGDPKAKDCAVAYRRGGKTLAVASIFRDDVSLQAEAAMERGDEKTLSKLIPA